MARVWVYAAVAVAGLALVSLALVDRRLRASPRALDDETADALAKFSIDPAAATVDERYPGLDLPLLGQARLSALPEGVLFVSGDDVVLEDEVAAEKAEAPAEHRKEIEKNALFILERQATQAVLMREVRESEKAWFASERGMLERYMDALARGIEVDDETAARFYDANRQALGPVTMSEVEAALRERLLERKLRFRLEDHVHDLARRRLMAVCADWVHVHAAGARDNPVDKARGRGKPVLAFFVGRGSMPSDLMKPRLREIEQALGERIETVLVAVDREPVLASRYRVHDIPKLIFFAADGREDARHLGMMASEEILTRLQALGADADG